jgi:hypothetical protein
MRYLPIKRVEAGMALAQDILDGQGVMLLGRHQILNQEQIDWTLIRKRVDGCLISFPKK